MLRLEQLYPFPHKAFEAELRQVPECDRRSSGARTSRRTRVHGSMSSTTSPKCCRRDQRLSYAGAPASASPAVGYYEKHFAQQRDLIADALGEGKRKAKKKKAS